MNRRKAMTAMIGGVAAAPQATKMAMQQLGRIGPPRGSPIPPSTPGYASEGNGPQEISLEEQRKHLLQRKEQLQALLRGEMPEPSGPPQRMHDHSHSTAVQSIGALRSVSAQHKTAMLGDLQRRRELVVDRWHWQEQLDGIENAILSWGKLFS